jgi:hypothetical protein
MGPWKGWDEEEVRKASYVPVTMGFTAINAPASTADSITAGQQYRQFTFDKDSAAIDQTAHASVFTTHVPREKTTTKRRRNKRDGATVPADPPKRRKASTSTGTTGMTVGLKYPGKRRS